jgi:hypothetical protein
VREVGDCGLVGFGGGGALTGLWLDDVQDVCCGVAVITAAGGDCCNTAGVSCWWGCGQRGLHVHGVVLEHGGTS